MNASIRRLRPLAASVLVLGLGGSMAHAQPGSAASLDVPAVPANLEVPPGYSVFLRGRAVGTQNFVCMPAPAGVAWRFLGPQATLFQSFDGETRHQIATHFLSANPIENGLPRPTWQHSFDSSAVWARVQQASSDPGFVEPGAIPWLLLEVTGTTRGTGGSALLARTAFIQRLNTSGGLAPSTGCAQPGDVGALALVPYVADYFFYRARPEKSSW